MKTYSVGIILALLLLAVCTVLAYLMGYQDRTRELNAIKAQGEQVLEAFIKECNGKITNTTARCEEEKEDIRNNMQDGS
jgi:hypothetical protein